MNMLIKNENSSNETLPLSDPQNDFKLPYESIEKAEILIKYLSSIFNLNDENKVLPDFDCRCLNVLSDIKVCEQDVIDIISTLNVDKAVGHDIISNRMLLAVKIEITKPLSLLFNRSMQEMFFPDQWKIAHAIALFKPSNYRSVSLLSCVSKILEKIVYKQIHNHLHINKLLYKFQSEFLQGYSTTHQLIELYDNILLALDKKQITSITFADISKAFDTAWIKALILKLENYGIKGKLLFWLKSYLSRRKQRVVITDATPSTGE